MPKKHVGFSKRDPLETIITRVYDDYGGNEDEYPNNTGSDDGSTQAFHNLKREYDDDDDDRESLAAERLSMRLLSVPDDDEEGADRILRESLHFVMASQDEIEIIKRKSIRAEKQATGSFTTMILLFMVGGVVLVGLVVWLAPKVIGPPRQPLGPYYLVERQVHTRGCSLVLLFYCLFIYLFIYLFDDSFCQ